MLLQLLFGVYKYNPTTYRFHSEDYVDFLRRINPDNMVNLSKQMERFKVGFVGQYDCPVFEGMYEFCRKYSGKLVL